MEIKTPFEDNKNTDQEEFDQFFTETNIKLLEKYTTNARHSLRGFTKTILPHISKKHYNWIPIAVNYVLDPLYQISFYDDLKKTGDVIFQIQISLYQVETYVENENILMMLKEICLTILLRTFLLSTSL